jgi:hypothetical protein
MARPRRGTLLGFCWRPAPGMGGRSRGAGEAILERLAGSGNGLEGWLLGSATTGNELTGAAAKEVLEGPLDSLRPRNQLLTRCEEAGWR